MKLIGHTYVMYATVWQIFNTKRKQWPETEITSWICWKSSQFLYNNQVKLKSPRPPQYQSQDKSQVIFNLIKRKQEKTDALPDILGSTDISVFPLSLKNKIGRKIGKSRQKRWVPFSPIFGGKKKKARSSQLPQKDNFLDFIQKKPSPFPVNRYDLSIST